MNTKKSIEFSLQLSSRYYCFIHRIECQSKEKSPFVRVLTPILQLSASEIFIISSL